jgi:hypothetical protein
MSVTGQSFFLLNIHQGKCSHDKLILRAAIAGVYFMNPVEEDAVVGRVVREHAEISRQLAVLDAERQRYQEMFASLAKRLAESDEILWDGEQWPDVVRVASSRRMADCQFSSDAIDGQKVKALCMEIKEARAKRDRLAMHLKNLV